MKIVMLSSACFSTTVIHNAVNSRYPVDRVITEMPMRGMALARRRMKKLGWFRVGGQVLFSVLLVPFIRRSAAGVFAAGRPCGRVAEDSAGRA